MIDAWRCNELLIETPQGLWLWRRSPMTAADPPHIFRPLMDNELWEWF